MDIGGGRHAGGSHGSLHRSDSLGALLTVGLDTDLADGAQIRLADVYSLVAAHFGLLPAVPPFVGAGMEREVGE
jgi:hypothetical protein